jgi:transcriptional regulator with XRE-family HTH domain
MADGRDAMQEDDIRALVRILRRIMEEEYLTMQGLARRLGFATSHLSMILSGKRRPGLRFLWAVMERYPEVRDLIMARGGAEEASKPKPPGIARGLKRRERD